jgi:hypothetical protein
MTRQQKQKQKQKKEHVVMRKGREDKTETGNKQNHD